MCRRPSTATKHVHTVFACCAGMQARRNDYIRHSHHLRHHASTVPSDTNIPELSGSDKAIEFTGQSSSRTGSTTTESLSSEISDKQSGTSLDMKKQYQQPQTQVPGVPTIKTPDAEPTVADVAFPELKSEAAPISAPLAGMQPPPLSRRLLLFQ